MSERLHIILNREIRVIPKGWEHPRDERGRLIPHHSREHYEDLMQTLEDDEPRPTLPPMPDVARLLPEETELAAYETTIEGTPISPAFPNTPEGRLALINFGAENCSTFGRARADAGGSSLCRGSSRDLLVS